MNEDAAVQAVKTIINANKATLVQGITQNGVARTIKHLATTNLAAPMEYYAVAVYCTNASEYAMSARNSVLGVSRTEYQMVVQLADVAVIQRADTLPYETSHADFRKFRDRVVKLIRDDTKWFPSQASTPRFRQPPSIDGSNDRRVNVENQNFSFSEAEGVEYAMLFSRITFELIDHCADSSLLYT